MNKFAPECVHKIFGEDEEISGFKDLDI